MNNPLVILIAFIFSQSAIAYDITDNLKVHGFFSQSAIHTSANNLYGHSENSISTDLTEGGFNAYYSPWDKLNFSFQALYRNAGEVDDGSTEVDYAFADLSLKQYEEGHYGLRIGRIKNPLGLYNETRDIAFTTPSIILPQGIYYDRSRSLLRSSDGVQFYLEQIMNDGALSLKLNYGNPRNDNDELLKAIIPYPTPIIPVYPQGDLEASSSDQLFLGQVMYERKGGEFIYAFSFADTSLTYKPKNNDLFLAGKTKFRMYILSMQYNAEKYNLTGEYSYIDNDFNDFGPFYPDVDSVTESWYLQAGYRIKPNWQGYIRYDEHHLEKDNRKGKNNDQVGLPRHLSFSKDIMIGIRWDINSSMMLRAEYHNLNGTSWLTSADNPDRNDTEQYWDVFSLQLSLRF